MSHNDHNISTCMIILIISAVYSFNVGWWSWRYRMHTVHWLGHNFHKVCARYVYTVTVTGSARPVSVAHSSLRRASVMLTISAVDQLLPTPSTLVVVESSIRKFAREDVAARSVGGSRGSGPNPGARHLSVRSVGRPSSRLARVPCSACAASLDGRPAPTDVVKSTRWPEPSITRSMLLADFFFHGRAAAVYKAAVVCCSGPHAASAAIGVTQLSPSTFSCSRSNCRVDRRMPQSLITSSGCLSGCCACVVSCSPNSAF